MWTPRAGLLAAALLVTATTPAAPARAQESCAPLPAGEAIRWSGTAPMLSEPVQLAAGLYRLTATHQGTRNYIVRLELRDADRHELLVNESGPQDLSRGARVSRDGWYLLNVVSANGPWTLELQRQ